MKFVRQIWRRLNGAMIHGRLNVPIRPFYNALIRSELAVQRGLDRLYLYSNEATVDLSKLTALVKTFERPHIVRRLIESIRRFYPGLHVIVVDDSREPVQLDGVETVILPFDSGVSAGKNAGLARVKTPYVLLLDDDFVFFRLTRIGPVLEAMEQHPEIDVLGGTVVNLPFFTAVDYRKANLFPTDAESNHPPGSQVGGFEVFDKVANFYVGRTERIRQVGWDPALKRIDHADFFTRAKGVLTTVYNPDFKVLHAQNRFDRHYMAHRTDYAVDQVVLRFKYQRPKVD